MASYLDAQASDDRLLLEDGTSFRGRIVGAGERGATGEVVFTTNMTGYQEVLTDPSYAGQIVVMTAPMMGVYGTAERDEQSRRPWAAGFVVRRLSRGPAGWRSEGSLADYLRGGGIPALVGADTRAITRHIREAGAMRGMLAPADLDESEALDRVRREPPMSGRDLATEVSVEAPVEMDAEGRERGLVLCLDYGVKRRSLDLIRRAGYRIRVLPATTPAVRMREMEPSGLFVSNGPGDPDAVPGAVERIRSLSDAGIPVFGICLGCQLVARTFGGRSYKLRYGHRGGNHPVRNLETGKVEITSQNHGFAVEEDADGRPAGADALEVTHRNLNDGTIEGVRHRDRPVFAVQYHPESAPGPHDSRYLFERFVTVMAAE